MAANPRAQAPVRDIVDYERLFDCVHCGLCLESCPTYLVTRREMDSPRGRIYLMKALAEGKLDLDQSAVRHFDLCLGCRGCETACPSGVRYGELIEQARDWVERNYRRPLGDSLRRFVIGQLFAYPRRLRMAVAPMALAERAGLRSLLQRTAPAAIRHWLELIPPLARSERGSNFHRTSQRASGFANPKADAPAVALHTGCAARVLAGPENESAARLLSAAGYRVVRLANASCCGALDLHSGNRERALSFARANVRQMQAVGATAVTTMAAGCLTTIAEYGAMLRDEPELAAQAHAVGQSVRDLSTLLGQRRLRFTRPFPCTVTYHEACHLAHGLKVREEPRRLLQSIPGLRMVELPESDLCCGSAGSYNLTEPAMARVLAARKAENILKTGADYVVMENPGCEFQIAAELRRRGAPIRALHLADFLSLALEDNPDWRPDA